MPSCAELFYSYQYYQSRANYWEQMRDQDQSTADGYMAQYEAADCPPLAAPPVPGQEDEAIKEMQAELEAVVAKFTSKHSKPSPPPAPAPEYPQADGREQGDE